MLTSKILTKPAAEPTAPVTKPSQFYRNISATTLSLDSGKLFPPVTIEELTEAEVARFQTAAKANGAKYIHPVAAPIPDGGQ